VDELKETEMQGSEGTTFIRGRCWIGRLDTGMIDSAKIIHCLSLICHIWEFRNEDEGWRREGEWEDLVESYAECEVSQTQLALAGRLIVL
jgi:hypothetical protein